MEALGHQYRCYALDFWGFGESGKKRDSYAVDDFMELVKQFMDALGIESAPVIGHSMGGTTALGTAMRYPERVRRVCVIGSPIVGSSLSVFLKLAGVPSIGSFVRGLPGLLMPAIRLFAPLITRHPAQWYPMLERDLSQTTVASFFSSIGSLAHTDLRPQLAGLHMPVTGVYGLRDVIVHPRQHAALQGGLPHARIEIMPRSGHFPMLDEPDLYLTHVKAFLESNHHGPV
jgi:pimeloyl-ACP methyl ester carboxylesterase